MSNVIQFPVIAGVEITTDEHGRFNLNALHRASGGDRKNGPSHWLSNEKTLELVEKLGQRLTDTENPVSPINVIKGGLNQGTFAHELLAVSYAGWIGPDFQLDVNQTFIDYKTGKLSQQSMILPNFTDPAEAAIAWAKEFKERQLVQVKLDHAIKTKAHIGSKREATAMARAANEARRADKAEALLGIAQQWKTVKAINWLSDVFDLSGSRNPVYSLIGKALTAISIDLGLEVNSVDDSAYGKVKSYHIDAISEFKSRLESDDSLLAKYRKPNKEKAA